MNKFDNLQLINTNTPRETLTYATDNQVIKTPVPGRMPKQEWITKQKRAKHVADTLNQIANSAYFVPRVLEIHEDTPHTIEQRAFGTPLTSSYFETLTSADHDIIYSALAHFLNDTNQMRPVMNQADNFNASSIGDNVDGMTISTVIEKLNKYIDARELQTVRDAKAWFDAAALNAASVVFAHGDMNENNIFYNPTTKTVSFIDFGDAKYQNIQYMFEHDFARLGWLDLDRLRQEYISLPRKQPVIITSEPNVEQMRNLLQNFTWTATEFLNKPNVAAKVRIQMIREEIAKLRKLYTNIQKQAAFTNGENILNIAHKQRSQNLPASKPDPQR